jgi:hypothetical protein
MQPGPHPARAGCVNTDARLGPPDPQAPRTLWRSRRTSPTTPSLLTRRSTSEPPAQRSARGSPRLAARRLTLGRGSSLSHPRPRSSARTNRHRRGPPSPPKTSKRWFEADLKKVDRSKTPWLIIYFHAPIVRWAAPGAGRPQSRRRGVVAAVDGRPCRAAAAAPSAAPRACDAGRLPAPRPDPAAARPPLPSPSSYEASFKQVECMRLTYEPLMYKVRPHGRGHPAPLPLPAPGPGALGWLCRAAPPALPPAKLCPHLPPNPHPKPQTPPPLVRCRHRDQRPRPRLRALQARLQLHT